MLMGWVPWERRAEDVTMYLWILITLEVALEAEWLNPMADRSSTKTTKIMPPSLPPWSP